MLRGEQHCDITTAIEHHAVLKPFEYLQKKEGFDITVLPIDGDGLVRLDDLEKAIRPETILISVMYANNEIGTIQPIAEIGHLVRRLNKIRAPHELPRIYFHTDACQAAGALLMDVRALGVDLLTFNGSKIYGPKGIGVLFVARGVALEPLVLGGGQERGLASGTENVAAIVGLAAALDLAQRNREAENVRLMVLRDKLIAGLLERIPKSRLNGHPTRRLPNNVNVTILDVEGEAMLLYLNEYGVACATGSACDSATLDPSHVILALGLPYEFAHGSMRFTLGRRTTSEDIDYVLEILPSIVETLREVSPVKLEMDPTVNTHPKILNHAPALNMKSSTPVATIG
jgi:cysteine desulfurase